MTQTKGLYLPDNCPAKLRAVIKEHEGKRHKIARALGVNVYWVQTYIKDWKEPSNPETRKKMYLPKTRRTRKPQATRETPPAHIQWWRRLDKSERNDIVHSAWERRSEKGQKP